MTSAGRFISFRDIGILFYLVPFRIAVSVLPVNAVRFLGSVLGYVYCALATGRKKRIRQRLRMALGGAVSDSEILALSRRCVYRAVTCHVDALILHRIGSEALLGKGQITGLEYLDNALLKGKGVMLVTGHFTGIKVASRFLHASGYPHFGVTKKREDDHGASQLENRFLAPYWSKVIDRRRNEPVFVEDKDVGLKIMRRLRENGVVMIFLDVPFSHHLVTRRFLGSARAFPVGFLRLVHTTGAVVVPMVSVGDSSGFRIRFEEAVELRQADSGDEFVQKNIDILVQILESQILRDPSHWLFI